MVVAAEQRVKVLRGGLTRYELAVANGSLLLRLRSNALAAWLVTFALVAALTGLWGLATPLFASADEQAHVVRAASVGRGELIGKTPRSSLLRGYRFVTLPAIYDSAGHHLDCFAQRPNHDASCHSFKGSETRTKSVITEAGPYPPTYYLVVGGVSRVWPTATGAVYLMRLTSVFITALFVTIAVRALSRMPEPRVALVGLAVALTPMVLAFGGTVNPSALELAAAVATWACGLVMVWELREGKNPSRGLVLQLGVAASALVLARQISMLWLAITALILGGLLGKDELRRLSQLAAARVWGVVIVVCTAAQVSWIVRAHGFNLTVPIGFEAHFSNYDIARETVGRIGGLYVEMLGKPGWLDTTLPALTYLLLTAALGALALLAVAVGMRRYLVGMFVTILVTIAAPIAFEAWLARTYGFYWQGRYTLPFALGVPLLAVFALQTELGARVVRRGWFVPALGGMLVVAHVLAFYQALRRWSVGTNGPVLYWLHPRWTAPIPQWLLIIGFAATMIAFVLWLLGTSRDAEQRGREYRLGHRDGSVDRARSRPRGCLYTRLLGALAEAGSSPAPGVSASFGSRSSSSSPQ